MEYNNIINISYNYEMYIIFLISSFNLIYLLYKHINNYKYIIKILSLSPVILTDNLNKLKREENVLYTLYLINCIEIFIDHLIQGYNEIDIICVICGLITILTDKKYLLNDKTFFNMIYIYNIFIISYMDSKNIYAGIIHLIIPLILVTITMNNYKSKFAQWIRYRGFCGLFAFHLLN